MTKTMKLDARLDADDRSVLQALEDLDAGEELIVCMAHDPGALLHDLLRHPLSRYEFSPVEAGPARWTWHVVARQPGPRSVGAYLGWDHDRLDEILGHAISAAVDGDWDSCRERLDAFRVGLFRHIRIEEDILFPVFEENTGMIDFGPTVVMREEHAGIHEAVEGLLAAARVRDAEGMGSWHANLIGVLVEHNMKEEQVLYPAIDRMLQDDDRDALVCRLLVG